MTDAIAIHHFGPDPADVGGMASVIRLLAGDNVGAPVVRTHTTWRPHAVLHGIPLALVAASRLRRVGPTEIVHVHLAENGAFIREGALLALARLGGRATVATLHGALFAQFAHKHPRLVAAVLRRAMVITCLDEEVCELARKLAPDSTVELLPNPVRVDRDAQGADQTEEIVLFAGEIGLRKGADVLWRAWQQVSRSRPRARCIMVGPVADFEVPPAERLEVLAPASPEQMRALLHSARVVALPSRAEGMPMILTEAMSVARPFVSTPVGGIPELAQAGGLLAEVGDEDQLATLLTRLLADPELAREIGQRGQDLCLHTRDVPVIECRLRELYHAAVTRAGSP